LGKGVGTLYRELDIFARMYKFIQLGNGHVGYTLVGQFGWMLCPRSVNINSLSLLEPALDI